MKIRTDFVTNSSSSSFCTLTVALRDGKEIAWYGEDGNFPLFNIPCGAEELLAQVKSIEDLVAFIKKSVLYDDEEEKEECYADNCEEFDKKIKRIKSFDDVECIRLEWSEYMSDEGKAPEDGTIGEKLEYNFKTKEYNAINEPDENFVKDMIEIYGDRTTFGY